MIKNSFSLNAYEHAVLKTFFFLFVLANSESWPDFDGTSTAFERKAVDVIRSNVATYI